MLLEILYFAAGLWSVAYFYAPPPLMLCAGLIIFFVLLRLFFSQYKIKKFFLLLIFFSAGVAWNSYHADQWLKHRLEKPERNGIVIGKIVELPLENKQFTRFILKTEQFDEHPEVKRLQLNWEKPHPDLQAGDRWEFMVRLKPPHALVNFCAFNRLRFLWLQNIHATGYVVSDHFQHLSRSPFYSINHLRQSLQQAIAQAISDPSLSGIISALTVGSENGLSKEDWNVLQRTGTVHLVVIAGLHIGFMVVIAYFLANRVWRCFPRLLLRIPAQKAAAFAALLFAFGYGALAGFGVPAQRAVIMIMVLMAGHLFYHETALWRRILFAAFAVILFQPGALFSAGFWLSFGAVSWIAYAQSGERGRAPVWRQWLQIQWALFLGLTPLTIYFFQQFSLVSLIANLPAILWIEWIIVPLCLLAALASGFSFIIGQMLFKTAAFLLKPLWSFLQWLAEWPVAGGHYFFSSEWILFLALLGAAWCLAPRGIPARWLGVLGFLPLCLLHSPKPEPGAVWLTVLDVGQGLSVVVRTTHHLLIYDAGARIPDGFDAGRDVVSPYLGTLGVKKADMLIVSHGDNDHSGGAQTILSQWPVQRFLTSVPNFFRGYPAEICAAGQQWEWDNVIFRVLGPPKNSLYRGNNSSCILQIGHQVLLVGDIEKESEASLVAQYGDALQSDLLIVPHHGSKTSSTLAFLQAVKPQYAVYSLGYFNRFHFPAPSVAARYETLGIKPYFTAESGAITLKMFPNKPIQVKTANPHHYFWQF